MPSPSSPWSPWSPSSPSSRSVVAGVDGSAESLAAAEWAAAEARRRALPLRIVHIGQDRAPSLVRPPMTGAAPASAGAVLIRRRPGRVPREVAERLRRAAPGLDVAVEQGPGRPARALLRSARDAEVLVLGSRGLGAVGGLLAGSVSLPVIAHAPCPVVVVRARAAAWPPPGPAGDVPGAAGDVSGAAGGAVPGGGEVVLGLDLARPSDALVGYAFDAAASRGAALRVVHGWSAGAGHGGSGSASAAPGPGGGPSRPGTPPLTGVLRPWRDMYAEVPVAEQCVVGSPGEHLAEAARGASLLVVGRRVRHAALGAHIGPVAHAVLRHCAAPVAVVPHA
ncbi:universal stress protein [Streptomyces fradiae]|uniref:universal stress protein n=1 Tax=Streptomyces fradiae TaxID=1906 RepID=UPI00379C95D7